MIEIIGLLTMVGLVWLLDFALATESEAEGRRRVGAPLKEGQGKRVAA